MKNVFKFIAIVAIVCASLTNVESAKKEKSELLVIEYQTDIDCPTCEKKVMDTLPYKRGVKSVNVDLSKKTIKVTFDPTKFTNAEVVESLTKIGVNVESKECPANCCQQ